MVRKRIETNRIELTTSVGDRAVVVEVLDVRDNTATPVPRRGAEASRRCLWGTENSRYECQHN